MGYRVRIESFEGPFDLLLYLVNRQKVDIGSVPINEIADQYLAEVRTLGKFDLDVASDFLVVAATLLEIKAASLVPSGEVEDEGDGEDQDPYKLRDELVDRLIEYKQFKNAAASLKGRFEAEARRHVRPFGPDRSLLTAMPDFLRGIEVDRFGKVLASMLARRDVFLLESEHIAARVIPLEERVVDISRRIRSSRSLRFSDLTEGSHDPHVIVVTFLAVLELFKRGEIQVEQDCLFGDIVVRESPAPEGVAGGIGTDGIGTDGVSTGGIEADGNDEAGEE